MPGRLGKPFRGLLASSVITNFGDGIALAAGPLLVASQTRDPLLVSMALLAGILPSLLFGVLGGAFADRFDRKRTVGGMVIGVPIGGLLAQQFGITAPFWFGFVGSALLVLVLWRQFAHIAHAGEV